MKVAEILGISGPSVSRAVRRGEQFFRSREQRRSADVVGGANALKQECPLLGSCIKIAGHPNDAPLKKSVKKNDIEV
jgi:hypothetical protein